MFQQRFGFTKQTTEMERKYVRKERGNFTNDEKRQLGELVQRYKAEYDILVVNSEGKTKFDRRRRKHVPDLPKKDYVSRAVRSFYIDMKDRKSNDDEFKAACKFATRSFQHLSKLNDSSVCPPKKMRAIGGGRKKNAPEVREALFSYFVDVRESMKGRFPKRLLRLKAKQLYNEWLRENPLAEGEKPLKFGNRWIQMWEQEYNISLRLPNKRCSISVKDRKTRIKDYLKNVWSVRNYFLQKYNVDPPIFNGDQIPLHRNESSEESTLHFKGQEDFVKEKHMLSRERITCFTTVSSSLEMNILPEFVFKGKGIRTKINSPPNVHYQWSPSGSYRLEHILKTISHLPNRYQIFSEKDYAIYVLDNYAVHLMPEVRHALFERGYILVSMASGITGDEQVNNTHVHRPLKGHYRDVESELILQKLTEDCTKTPNPDRSEIIDLTLKAWGKVSVDYERAFKQNFVTNAFNGSEDFLVSDRIFRLVGEDMIKFRKELLSKPPPKSLKDVVKNLIPPKCIARSVEGSELLDYMTDVSETENVVADVELTTSDEEEEEPEETEENTTTSAALEMLVNVPSTSFVPLAGHSMDDELEEDTSFMDKIGHLFDSHKTSTLFLPYRTKLFSDYNEARRSVTRRIEQKHK